MAPEIYIFGYQSMLAEGSLAASVGVHTLNDDVIPARLQGFVRKWNAVRDFSKHPGKRYVHLRDWRPAGRVAFAHLAIAMDGIVNGVCHRLPADKLAALDFREQGYLRVPVGDRIRAYPGRNLSPGLPCYAYVDQHPDPVPAPVSRAYYDMGRQGAESIDRVAPGFALEYLASTQLPPMLADDLAFVSFSADGRHLWLLNEADSTLVLLLRFSDAQVGADSKAVCGELQETQRPITPDLEWLDYRHRQSAAQPHPRIPDPMASELTLPSSDQSTASRLAASSYWLCRLTATQRSDLPADLLTTLLADPDPWVRRAAQIRQGDKG